MWQRFTERARRVILLGQEEAAKMNSSHVGTEHLLLGLIRENESVAAQVLQKMNVSLERVRQEIEDEIEPSEESVSSEPKLTPRSKRVLELAAEEARRMKHNYIGTEHLLLALLREKDGVAAMVLRKLGLNLEETRHQVLEYLGPEATPMRMVPPHSMVEHILDKAPGKTNWILPLLVRLLPRELRAMGQELRQLNKEKDAAILVDDYETAAKLRDEARELEKRMEEFADQWEQAMEQPLPSDAKFDLAPITIEILITQIEAAIDALASGNTEQLAATKERLAALKISLRGGAADE